MSIVKCLPAFCLGPTGNGGGVCEGGHVGNRCDIRKSCCPDRFKVCVGERITCACCALEETCCVGDRLEDYRCCPQGYTCCGDDPANCCLAPKVELNATKSGPPVKITLTVQDREGTGLSTIKVLSAVNATVEVPPFSPGAVKVQVTATKDDPTRKSSVTLQTCSLSCSGKCCQIGDPAIATLRIPEDANSLEEVFLDIPPAERFIRVQNGDPGLRRLEVHVNGEPLSTHWLRSGVVRFLEIPPTAMTTKNRIQVIANGRPGSSALFLLSDASGETDPAKAGHPIWIDWDATDNPDVNQHWGN
jgi:hypothetical protein